MKREPGLTVSFLALLLASSAGASELPRVYALTNVRVVPVPGKVVERGTVVVRRGLVEAVGANVSIPKDAQLLDLAGKTVYPGLVDPHVSVSRLSGRRPPRDDEEDESEPGGRRPAPLAPTTAPAGNVHPSPRVAAERRAQLSISPEVREKLRALGFTVVAAVPDQGTFRGESAAVSLGDLPLSESVLLERWAHHVALDVESERAVGQRERSYPVSKMGEAALVRQTFLDARWAREALAAYERHPQGLRRPERLDAWTALGNAAEGRQPVVFEVPDVLALLRAGKLAKELGLSARYAGSGDFWRLADEVKALAPELILPLAFPKAPLAEDDDEWLDVPLERLRAWDRAPSAPRWAHDLGLTFSLTTDGLPDLADLPAEVRKARARGLSASDLLAAFTTVPARMLGLSSRIGEIAPGKAANLVVVSGRLFEEGSRVVETWVDGIRYPVREKKVLPSGRYRVEGFVLEIRVDPKTGIVSAQVSPATGGVATPARSVVRREGRVEIEVEGRALGLPEGTAFVEASLEGESVRLDVKQANARTVKRGEREGPPDDAAKEKRDEEPPDSDVRPLPSRFASPLAEPRAVLVKEASIWTQGPAGTLRESDLLFVDGKVAAVGKGLAVPPVLAGSVVEVDGRGKAITPGLIDAHSHTAVDGDVNEGFRSVSAEVRIADVLDPFDPSIARELAGGLTTSRVLHGSANAIGGQSAVIKLRLGQGPDGLLLSGAPPGIKFALGENPKHANSTSERGRYPRTRMGVSALIRERFAAARDYRRKQSEAEAARSKAEPFVPVRRDLQHEAIAEVLEGRRTIQAHAYVKQEILDLLRLCEEHGVRVGTFEHTLEGYKVADEIAAHGAGASTFSDWWGYKFEVYDAIPWNAALMKKRGVLVSLKSDSDELARRLNLEAAKTVRYGRLAPEEALSLVTTNPARQIGVERRVGSLEPGKDADFVVWSGDPLSPFSVCLETWIEGKKLFDRASDLAHRVDREAEKADLIARAKKAVARGAPSERGSGKDRKPERSCHEEDGP